MCSKVRNSSSSYLPSETSPPTTSVALLSAWSQGSADKMTSGPCKAVISSGAI